MRYAKTFPIVTLTSHPSLTAYICKCAKRFSRLV